MSDDTGKRDGLPEPEISQLRDLRLRLLHLHKTLLDMERASYEKMFGSVNSGELLQLVINGTQFAWLRMLSALVVEIDETLDGLDGDEPATPADMRRLLARARLLFTSPDNEVFRQKYRAALQHEAAVVMAHAEVMSLLRECAEGIPQ